MNPSLPLLAADAVQVIWIIIVVVVLVMSVVGQLITKIQDAQREAARRARAGQARPQPPRRDALEDEIGEFLKRTAQRQQQQQQQPGAGRAAAPPASGRPRPLPPPPAPPARPPEPVVVAEVLPPGQESVAEHVRHSLGAGKFNREISDLGSRLSQTDEKMEQHLREAFEHQVGSLAGTAASVAASAAASAAGQTSSTALAGLAEMLRNPDSVRQVIVMSEILNRPEHRWS